MNAAIKGVSIWPIEFNIHRVNINIERYRIVLISLLFLNGYKTNSITAKTIKGLLNRSVTVKSTPNRTSAVSEITTSCALIVVSFTIISGRYGQSLLHLFWFVKGLF